MHHSRQTLTTLGLATLIAIAGVACSGDKTTPTSPSASTTSPTVAGTGTSGTTAESGGLANADGSTLKVTAPGNLNPTGNLRVDSRQPILSWAAATGRFATATTLTYQIEIYRENILTSTIEQAALSYTIPTDIDYDIVYRWRVRAKLGTAVGPWASTANFIGPEAPPPPPPPTLIGGGGGGQPYGPQRDISFNEAFGMIVGYHNAINMDLGSRSTRDQRVAFLWSAVAIIHYGHPQLNPAGGDRNWCVKDAGAGRPPSDDVLARCDTREAWDLIGGTGANGYSFHNDYLGRLPSNQNVFAPPLSSLPASAGGAVSATFPPLVDGTPVAVNGKIADPPEGRRLPLPNMERAVIDMGGEFAVDLRNSCGNFVWLDKVIDRLREKDDRWGYNCKAGNCAAPAPDEIVYHWGAGTREGSPQVYTIDIISSHCGAVPAAGWRDFTNAEKAGFTSRGRFTAIKP